MDLTAQFLLINGHFVLNLLSGLVTFAVAWLYFDAWTISKNKRDGSKALGFLLLCLSFVVQSASVEQTNLSTPLFIGVAAITTLANSLEIAGYLVLITGQLIDPIQPLPSYRKTKKSLAFLPFTSLGIGTILGIANPILATITGLLYLHRATNGLEHHLKPISLSFFILSFSRLVSLATVFQNTNNVNLNNLTAPFGPLWIIEHTLLTLSMLVLGIWVWSYLVKRIETQLFMIFTSTILLIFLATTVTFTGSLITDIRKNTLASLNTNANVLSFAIENKKEAIKADATLLANNPKIRSALADKNTKDLDETIASLVFSKKIDQLAIVESTGQIITTEQGLSGGSLSDDPLVRRATENQAVSAIVTKPQATTPAVTVSAASPIKNDTGEVVGVIRISNNIDNAFVDGLKKSTGLEASIYADNVRAATTFIAVDGKSRWLGVREENSNIKETVLLSGENYTGPTNLLGTPFLAAYNPLKDINDNPIGMLFVGTTQQEIINLASQSLERTFLITIALLTISIIPSYLISNYIVDQLKH